MRSMNAPTGSRIAQGAVWMVGARLVDRLVGFVSTLILARLLTPADFGLVAMAMAVIGLIELASAFGFEVQLLRIAQPTRSQYDTVWSLNALFGLGCAAVTAAAAWPAATFYGDERLVAIMLALALGWAIGALENVGIVDFRRNLQFNVEFRFLITKRVLSFVVTLTIALLARSYWALVIGTVAGRTAGMVLSYLWHPYRPRPSLAAAREMFSFSLWIFVERIAAFANSRSSDFYLGRVRGPAEVGIYRIGEEIGYLPGSEFVAPLNRALLPGISRMADSGQHIGEMVTAATGVIALALLPACLGLAVVADAAVPVLLGRQWTGAVPVVQVMAVNALFIALWANQHTALLAAGAPRLTAYFALVRLTVFVPCFVALAPANGAVGVAIAALAASVVAYATGLGWSLRRLSMSIRSYLGAVWRPLVASLVMAATVRAVDTLFATGPSVLEALLRLAGGIVAGAVTYAVALAALFLLMGRPHGAERLVIDRLKRVAPDARVGDASG
jgi:O-antigen/teichoic acid export membrane protein